MRNTIDLLMNPETEKILQYISRNDSVTAKEISSVFPEISKATIYRKLKALEEAKIITVIDETQVRGAVEKTFAVNDTFLSTFNTVERAEENVYSFIVHLLADFSKYFQDATANPFDDNLFLQNYTIFLSDEECETFQKEMEKVVEKVIHNRPKNGRKERNISIISSPIVKR